MMINKKIYKYTAIISFAMVLILMSNLIAPAFTWAEEVKNNVGFLSDINYNESESTISVSGTLPEGVKEYKLYWSVGEIPMEKLPENATDEEKDRKIDNLIAWSIESNHLLTDVVKSNSREINSVVNVKNDRSQDVQYNVLCIATDSNNCRIMQMKVLKLGARVVVQNNVTVYEKSDEEQEEVEEEYADFDKQLNNNANKSESSNNEASVIKENKNEEIKDDKKAEENDEEVIEVTVTPKVENQKVEEDGYISIDEPTENKPQVNESNVGKSQNDDVKKNEVKTSETKTEETKKDEVKIAETKINDNKTIENNLSDAMVAKQEIPQAGSNETPLIMGIIVFSMISVVSFVKYLKANE